jgi:hypothetical protein
MMTRFLRVSCVALSLLWLPQLAAAQAQTAARYGLVVEGASGEEQYAKLHREWVDRLLKVMRDKFGFDAAHLAVLTETPGPGEQASTAVNLHAALNKIAAQAKPADTVFIMLIRHGSGTGNDAKFNLVGPDLTVTEWNTALKPVAARIAFVDTTSASSSFIQGLAAPNRVVITATDKPAQVYHPVFGDAFIQALTDNAADLDKNDRISVWEAFVYATRLVQQHYERAGLLSTEHAMLTDSPDGASRDAASNGTATLAGMTYLDAPVTTTSTDPAVIALFRRRDELNSQIDALRLRKGSMPAAEYDQAFEKLALELATVSQEIRKKTGG